VRFEADRAGDGLEVLGAVAIVEARGLDALVQQVQGMLLAVADRAEDLMSPPPRPR